MTCVNANYNVMAADGGGYVSSAGSAGAAGSASAAGSAGESSGPRDDSSIGAFAGLGEDFDMEGDLNALYEQKAQAEQELGDLQGRRDAAQAKISDRRQELINKKQSGEDNGEQQQLESVKDAYEQTVAARDQAQQELNQLNNDSSTKDREINTNAQQTQQKSSELTAAQNRLNSLTPPAQPGGDDEEAQSSYQAALSEYESQKAALQAEVDRLQGELQQLQSEGQQLQNEKSLIDRDKSAKQMEAAQLEAAVQSVQQALDQYQQQKIEGDPELQGEMENDAELQQLQSDFDELDGQLTAKQDAITQIDQQIAAAEAKNSGLQAMREEGADQEFHAAASDIGFDADEAELQAKQKLAENEFHKNYEELTEEEKLSLEARVDGEVTLEALERAEQLLRENPDNPAAQAVVEKAAKNLEAQEKMTQANFYSSLDNLPASLQEGALQAMQDAKAGAQEGTDPEAAAMEALSDYLTANAGEDELSDDELAALDDILGAAGDYMDARETSAKGDEILAKAAESMGNSDLAAMKAQVAAKMGVSPDQLTVISATEGDDYIYVQPGEDGGISVNINGEVVNYTAEEAKYLIFDAGKGDDWIEIDDRLTQDVNIFGGDGNDNISGGAGNNIIFGGNGADTITGGSGNNVIFGGAGEDFLTGGSGSNYIDGGDGSDTVYGGSGSNVIFGGEGNDYITGGDGQNVIDGGAGDDNILGGRGNDVIYGGEGNDFISGGEGDDYIDGGEGDDRLYGFGGNDIIMGAGGNDLIDGGDGEDVLDGGDGDDEIKGGRDTDLIFGGSGKDKIQGEGGDDFIFGGDGDDDIDGGRGDDMIFGEAGNDTLRGSDGDDTIYGEGGADKIKGGSGDDCISGGDGNDKIEGENGKDIIYGNAGDDDINGGHGHDTIYGGDGNDHLDGGSWFRDDDLYWYKEDEPAYPVKPGEFDGNLGDIGGDLDTVLDYTKDAVEGLGGKEAGANAMSVIANGMIAYSDVREGLRDGSALQVAGGVSAGLEGAGSATSVMAYLGEKLHVPQAKLDKLNVMSSKFGFAAGVLQGASGVGDFAESLRDGNAHGAVDAAYAIADGVKGTAGAIDSLYSGTSKILGSMGTVARVAGGIGGALTVFSGIMEAYEGWEDHDNAKIASGVFRTISGGTAIAAACCPAAAPVLLVVSGICALIDVGIGWIWGRD